MNDTIIELKTIVQEFAARISEIPEADFSAKPRPEKWSKKEVIGHLIDSGQNNLRRFICGQYENDPPKIVYEQDFWVAANNYQKYTQKDIIELWKLTNAQICFVLTSMPAVNYTKCVRSNKNTEEEKTLEWLADDYVKHLKHHLNQVIEKSFDITYP